MADTFKKKFKFAVGYTWTLFKSSVLPSFMYFCAGSILMMLTMKGKEVDWSNNDILYTVLCILGGAGYNALASWANGGAHYEMLVSGNVKRSAYDAYGNPYKMSSHKIAKEYRIWKGFAIGAFTALTPILFGILLGVNQTAIDGGETGKGLGVLLLLAFFLSGWSIIPLYCLNQVGVSVSYFVSIAFAIIPIAVTGGMYIAGAYTRRNKAIRQQKLAEQAALAEEERKKNKKINYGGLPGTKPKKRK